MPAVLSTTYLYSRVVSNSCKDVEHQAGQRQPYFLKADQPLPASGAGHGHNETSLPRGTGAVRMSNLILHFPKAPPTRNSFLNQPDFHFRLHAVSSGLRTGHLAAPCPPTSPSTSFSSPACSPSPTGWSEQNVMFEC